MAARGAKVTVIDVDLHYLKQAKWAAGIFGLQDRIDFFHMHVYDLVKTAWKYDIILFMGVFYHLRYPMLAVDIVSEKTDRLLVFQSLSLGLEEEREPVEDFGFDTREIMQQKYWPSMSFIENQFLGDPTNWWVPNPPVIKAIFRTAGFRFLHSPGHEIYFFEREHGIKPVIQDWNRSEFLSATGREWKTVKDFKTGRKKKMISPDPVSNHDPGRIVYPYSFDHFTHTDQSGKIESLIHPRLYIHNLTCGCTYDRQDRSPYEGTEMVRPDPP